MNKKIFEILFVTFEIKKNGKKEALFENVSFVTIKSSQCGN